MIAINYTEMSDDQLEKLAETSENSNEIRSALNELRSREARHLNRRVNFLSDRLKNLLKKETQLSAINSFGSALLTKHTVGAISWAVCRNLVESMAWDCASFFAEQSIGGDLIMMAYYNGTPAKSGEEFEPKPLSADNLLVKAVLEDKSVIILETKDEVKKYGKMLVGKGSAMAYPILAGDKVVAVFASSSHHEYCYTRDHVSLLSAMSNIISAKLLEAHRNDQIKSNRVLLKGLVEERTNKLKQAVTLLREQNLEKDVLLKEVHHRVKNNMQIIISLLRLQSNSVLDKEAIGVIKNSQNRIMAMAMIHEQLYNSENLSLISAKNYISDLAINLKLAYDVSEAIELKYDLDNIPLDLEKLVPIGLIVNELLTNSLKHAFSEKVENPEVFISFKQGEGGRACLTLSDNGKGFDSSTFDTTTDTLGFELVKSLADQLDGEVKVNQTDNGSAFVINFNY